MKINIEPIPGCNDNYSGLLTQGVDARDVAPVERALVGTACNNGAF